MLTKRATDSSVQRLDLNEHWSNVFPVFLFLWGPLTKYKLVFLASPFSPETCQYRLRAVQRRASDYTHSPALFCVSGGCFLSLSAFVCLYTYMCHRWWLFSDYCGDQSITALLRSSSPAFSWEVWVGGEGTEGRDEGTKRRVSDGKWPPPQCQMGGGFKESSLVLLSLGASWAQTDPSFCIRSLPLSHSVW